MAKPLMSHRFFVISQLDYRQENCLAYRSHISEEVTLQNSLNIQCFSFCKLIRNLRTYANEEKKCKQTFVYYNILNKNIHPLQRKLKYYTSL